MQRRPFNRVALVAIGLVGLVAVTAATALAARSSASPFELVFTGRYDPFPECAAEPENPLCFDMQPATGTFTSGAPFCESGTGEQWLFDAGRIRRYTCADGSGSLTLSISHPYVEWTTGSSGRWEIDEGSGRYEDLRGRGTYTGELLSGNPMDVSKPLAFRTTAQGFAGVDTGAPSVAFTSATATKLRRPAGAYSIRVAFSALDDFEGLPVAYRLKVTEGSRELNSRQGETASGSVSTMLRIQPSSKRPRSVDVHLRAVDWLGNDASLVQSLKLPR
jgi:hypothetical protein